MRLLSGPFADQIAQVNKLDAAGRVCLLLSIIGSHTPVWVAREAVTRVD